MIEIKIENHSKLNVDWESIDDVLKCSVHWFVAGWNILNGDYEQLKLMNVRRIGLLLSLQLVDV